MQSLTTFSLSFSISCSAKGMIVIGRTVQMRFIKSYLGKYEFLSSSVF